MTARAIATACALFVAACATPAVQTQETAPMTQHARGTFEVKMAPLAQDAPAGSTHMRMSLDKTYTGDLAATGKGEMVAVRTDVANSAVYVAIERVTGTLNGREGAFSLVHRGVMDKGAQELSITIVPDSGSGALTGISGALDLKIADGVHAYDIAYTLPAAP